MLVYCKWYNIASGINILLFATNKKIIKEFIIKKKINFDEKNKDLFL
jgi:hypothetical protein